MRNDPREVLGRGWAFPFGFDSATGAVAWSEYEENIRQNITIILGFGCRIHEMMFAPNTRNTSSIVAHHVREALTRWEPRIEVVKVEANPDQGGSIRVEVEYRVRATDALQNIALAFGG